MKVAGHRYNNSGGNDIFFQEEIISDIKFYKEHLNALNRCTMKMIKH